MRTTLLLLVGLLAATTFGLALLNGASSGPGSGAPGQGPAVGALGGSDVDARVRELEAQVQALRAELEGLRAVRSDLGRAAGHGSPVLPGPTSVSGEPGLTPHEALARYVASFQGGQQGLEYYRLVVQAHLPLLVDDVLPLVLDPSGHPPLRTRLAELLGDPRLRGTRRLVDGLLTTASQPAHESVAWAAAHAVAVVAGTGDAPELERRWWRPSFENARSELLGRLFELCGADPNPLVQRLLEAAPRDDLRALLLDRLHPTFTESALAVFQAVRAHAQPVRLAGARHVHVFRSAAFRVLVDQWRASEPDDEVRAALGEALEHLAQVPNHHPERATGPPDVDPVPADDVRAWAPARADGGEEWLELTFPEARPATGLVVHQTCSPGALVRVDLILEDGREEPGWSASGSGSEPGAFELPLSPSGAVRGVRLHLDTARVSGWNEIDAVRLVSPTGSQWASGARASSWYGMDHGRDGGWRPDWGNGLRYPSGLTIDFLPDVPLVR